MHKTPDYTWQAVYADGRIVKAYKFGQKCQKWISENNNYQLKRTKRD